MKKRCAMVLGVILLSAMAAFANGSSEASSTGEEETKTLNVLGTWVSSEGDAFEDVLKGFTEKTGIEVIYEGVNDPRTVLGTRIAGGDLPDAAALGGGEGFLSYADQGVLQSLDFMKDDISANFADSWIVPLTVGGEILSIPLRCNVQNCLWYNPEAVGDVDLSSWESFIAYLDGQKAQGKTPLSGFYKLSWGVNILFASTLSTVATFGQYQQYMTGHMAMTDPVVLETFRRMSLLVSRYMPGGAEGALGTDLTEGFALVFGTDPVAQFINSGSWGGGIVTGGVNENAVPGKTLTYDLFPGHQSVETNCDNIVMFVDSPECRQLMQYLASTEGISRFAKYGYVVANKNVDPELYEDPMARKSMSLLKDPHVVPDMVMQSEYASAFYQLLQDVIANPGSIEALAAEFEATYGDQRTVI